MDKLILLTIVLISMILSSCDTLEEAPRKEPQEITKEGIEGPEGAKEGEGEDSGAEATEEPEKAIIDVIFENTVVDQDTFVGDVKVGDEIIIHLEGGVKTVPKFSKIYSKTVTSSWIKSQCELSHINVSQKKGGKVHDCIEIKEYGDCNIFRRDYVGEVESPIVEFARESENIPVYFTLGGKPYSLDKINFPEGSSDESSVTGSLKITEGMVQEPGMLYLQPVNTSEEIVKVGFLGYGHCPNRNKREFQISPPTALQFHEVSNHVRRRFQVNLSIIRSPSLRPSTSSLKPNEGQKSFHFSTYGKEPLIESSQGGSPE